MGLVGASVPVTRLWPAQVVKIPEGLWGEMRALLLAHVNRPNLHKDAPVNIVENGEEAPDFVYDTTGLFARVHDIMRPIHEQWSGIPLEPTFHFGLRVYAAVCCRSAP